MKKSSSRPHHYLDIKRLIALTDGVYGVALTLLVLDLKPLGNSTELIPTLQQLFPRFLIYILVFGSVIGYWTIHHRIFQLVRYGDGKLVLLSLLNLLFVTLYPVAASIVGSFPTQPMAIVILSVNSLFYCLSAWAVFLYISKHPYLLSNASHFDRLNRMALIMAFTMLGLFLSIPLAFISVYLAYAAFILCVPLAMVLVRFTIRP